MPESSELCYLWKKPRNLLSVGMLARAHAKYRNQRNITHRLHAFFTLTSKWPLPIDTARYRRTSCTGPCSYACWYRSRARLWPRLDCAARLARGPSDTIDFAVQLCVGVLFCVRMFFGARKLALKHHCILKFNMWGIQRMSHQHDISQTSRPQ